MDHMVVEHVWCCVCRGTGSVAKFVFWKRACRVCDGQGERPIMMDERFPESVKDDIRLNAKFGVNTHAALTGRRNNAAVQAASSFGLI